MTKNVIEVRGKDVEAAITTGLTQLKLERSEVTIDIIDEGSRGLLGIGSRDAVVKLTYELVAKTENDIVAVTTAPVRDRDEVPVRVAAVKEPIDNTKPVSVNDVIVVDDDVAEADLDEETTAVVKEPTVTTPTTATDDDEAYIVAREKEKECAIDIVQTLLDKMQINATVASKLSEPDDLTGKQINVLAIEGDDLGSLIGPRGETLNALQYVTRLAVGHRLHQRADFVIDVEGYRQRRQQALSRLAERMAQKAMRQQRAISLEPMPPHERRIIHMALRENEVVYTESAGEGKRRKVRIIPK